MRFNKNELVSFSTILPLINKHYTDIISNIKLSREVNINSEETIVIEIETHEELDKVVKSKNEFFKDWVELPFLIRDKFLVVIKFLA